MPDQQFFLIPTPEHQNTYRGEFWTFPLPEAEFASLERKRRESSKLKAGQIVTRNGTRYRVGDYFWFPFSDEEKRI
jgi:hypothetical protein